MSGEINTLPAMLYPTRLHASQRWLRGSFPLTEVWSKHGVGTWSTVSLCNPGKLCSPGDEAAALED